MNILSVFVEPALRSVLIAGAVGLTLKAMRIESPAVRHAMWTGVLIVMMALPVLSFRGPRVSLPILPNAASVTLALVPAPPFDVLAGTTPSVTTLDSAARAVSAELTKYAAAVYLVGLAFLLFRLGLGTLQVRKVVSTAVLDDGRLTHRLCATPITMGWLRPVSILPSDWRLYPSDQLDAILVHEAEHVRRRDPLIQWFALLNRAVFWFHPLAWWLERQLSALAEQACDAAVLACGCEPHQYAECLVSLARVTARMRGRIATIGMTLPGPDLTQRVHLVLNRPNTTHLSGRRVASMAVLCAVAGATLTAGTLAPARGWAVASDNRQTGRSLSMSLPNAVRGFAISVDGHLRAHGFISDQDRTEAAMRAAGTDHVWLRDGSRLYLLTDPDAVKQTLAMYQHADSCAGSPTDVPPRRRNDCGVSDAEVDAARTAPDVVAGLTLERKALIARVFAFLGGAAKNGQAYRIR